MKRCFRIYDQGNYLAANQLFNTQELKTIKQHHWTYFKTGKHAQTSSGWLHSFGCWSEERHQISKLKTFPSDKMDAPKLAAKNKCYSIAQIRQLCELFMIEKDKLDVMKIFMPNAPIKITLIRWPMFSLPTTINKSWWHSLKWRGRNAGLMHPTVRCKHGGKCLFIAHNVGNEKATGLRNIFH